MPISALDVTEQHSEALEPSSETSSLVRIRSMLDRAHHATTPRAEADRATALAAREMRRHNIEEQLVVERTDTLASARDTCRVGGSFRVDLRNGAHPLRRRERWIEDLSSVCADGFSVKRYHMFDVAEETTSSYFFYGARANAELAANAYKTYINRIEALTKSYHVDMTSLRRENAGRGALSSFGSAARSSYRFGLVEGLRRAFEMEKREERARVSALETNASQARLAQEAKERREHFIAAQSLHQLADNDNDEDNDELLSFDVNAAEREVVACRALTTRLNALCDDVLIAHNIVFEKKESAYLTAATRTNTKAYDDGVVDATRMRAKRQRVIE